MIECLLSMHSALGLVALLHKLGPVYNPTTQEMETEESGVQDHLWLHSEFKASRDLSIPCPLNKILKFSKINLNSGMIIERSTE